MVLADLRRRVALRFDEFSNRRIGVLYALFRTRQPDHYKTGPERGLAKNECGAPRRAGLLAVVVGELRSFISDAINVRRTASHHSLMVGAEIPHADVVTHDHDDVGRLLCRCLRRCHTTERKREREYRGCEKTAL